MLTNLQGYLKFFKGEKFTSSREPVFLPPNEHTLLTASSDDKDSYRFIVWEGFNNSTVSYTVSEDVSMYDTTNFRHCTTHRYYSKSDKHDDQSAAFLAFVVIGNLCSVIIWCCCILCCTCTCYFAIKDVLRDPKAKRVETTQTSTK